MSAVCRRTYIDRKHFGASTTPTDDTIVELRSEVYLEFLPVCAHALVAYIRFFIWDTKEVGLAKLS